MPKKKEEVTAILKRPDGGMNVMDGQAAMVGCLRKKGNGFAVEIELSFSEKEHLFAMVSALLLELDNDPYTKVVLELAIKLFFEQRQSLKPQPSVKKKVTKDN